MLNTSPGRPTIGGSPTFGRRKPPSAPPPQKAATPVIQRLDARQFSAHDLSAEAEAFRDQLISEGRPSRSGFSSWLRDRHARLVMAWVVTVGLLCPGAVSFVLHAPASMSGGLEIAGVAANIWFRRMRKRHLNAIATWEEADS